MGDARFALEHRRSYATGDREIEISLARCIVDGIDQHRQQVELARAAPHAAAERQVRERGIGQAHCLERHGEVERRGVGDAQVQPVTSGVGVEREVCPAECNRAVGSARGLIGERRVADLGLEVRDPRSAGAAGCLRIDGKEPAITGRAATLGIECLERKRIGVRRDGPFTAGDPAALEAEAPRFVDEADWFERAILAACREAAGGGELPRDDARSARGDVLERERVTLVLPAAASAQRDGVLPDADTEVQCVVLHQAVEGQPRVCDGEPPEADAVRSQAEPGLLEILAVDARIHGQDNCAMGPVREIMTPEADDENSPAHPNRCVHPAAELGQDRG